MPARARTELGLNVEGLGIWRCVGAVLGCTNVLALGMWVRYRVAVC